MTNLSASRPLHHVAKRRPAQGVVLVIALVLVLVIAFSSAFILRNALFGDSATNNLVSSQSANHAAEVALRYCEQLVLNPATAAASAPVQPLPDTQQPLAWRTQANWGNANFVINVPANTLQSQGRLATVTYAQLPQCIIEQIQIRNLDNTGIKPYGLQITARGYSADYQNTAGNRTGSEVILQSVLRMPNCKAELKMVC